VAADYRTWGLSWGESWGDSWGLGEEEVATLVARPIDFVISPPYYMHQIQTYRKAAAKPERKRDKKEFMEMLQMYNLAAGAL
jgi:hypothetical protein